jgi:hypothetical protein
MIKVSGSAKLTINDGVIIKNFQGYSGNVFPNLVSAIVVDSTFTMNGGEISDNLADKDGGAVSLTSGYAVFTMHGGTISGNSAGAAGNGGGVYVLGGSGADFIKDGGTIGVNTATSGNAAYIAGTPLIRNNTAGASIDLNSTTGIAGTPPWNE